MQLTAAFFSSQGVDSLLNEARELNAVSIVHSTNVKLCDKEGVNVKNRRAKVSGLVINHVSETDATKVTTT